MQGRREWRTAFASDWGTALQREAVIRPLAEQTRLAALLAFGLEKTQSTVAFGVTGNDRKLLRR